MIQSGLKFSCKYHTQSHNTKHFLKLKHGGPIVLGHFVSVTFLKQVDAIPRNKTYDLVGVIEVPSISYTPIISDFDGDRAILGARLIDRLLV